MAEWMGTRRDGRWPPTAARADVGRCGRVVTCLHLLGRRVCHGPPGIPCGAATGCKVDARVIDRVKDNQRAT